MKVCIIQPEYSLDYSRSDELFRWELDALEGCDESMDLIVLPESSDVPAYAKTRELALESNRKYLQPLLEKAAATAKRCSAVLFVNGYRETETGLRNTTFAFDREGHEVGHYYKQHLTPGETSERKLDSDYTFEFSESDIVVIDGIRYGFLTCYDFYFYEAFAKLARSSPDIVIGCSHQRTDTHAALEMMSRFCAYNCNAYVVRSSVSMGKDSEVGGSSMVVSPRGEVLANMLSDVGMITVDIDPTEKYYKPGGFGNPLMAHHEYIEKGRRPWKYRPAGSAIVRHDGLMPYPRICAHRGFNTVAPENSMPAFGAAVALGAEEIEFDLWTSKDGVIVSIHDSKLDRVSNGTGYVWEHTYGELLQYDFGSVHSEEYAGLKIPTFEDILKKFACHVIMNIHIKHINDVDPLPEETLQEIIRLIRKYDCEKYSYFMSGNIEILKQLQRLAPDITRCAGAGDPKTDLVDKALAAGCKKIQLFKPHFALHGEGYVEEIIKRAHDNGIRVNYFYADDPEEARHYLALGVDTVLTNDYQRVSTLSRG